MEMMIKRFGAAPVPISLGAKLRTKCHIISCRAIRADRSDHLSQKYKYIHYHAYISRDLFD